MSIYVIVAIHKNCLVRIECTIFFLSCFLQKLNIVKQAITKSNDNLH